MAKITEVVSATEGLKTLSEALIVSGLDDVLSGDGPFTLFAPNDDAFSELDTETLVYLASDREDLAAMLLSHVVRGNRSLSELTDVEFVETSEGSEIWVSLGEDGGVYVEEARVLEQDIEAENGIIHIIDLLMLPLQGSVDQGAASGSEAECVYEAVTLSDFVPFGDFEAFGKTSGDGEPVAV